MSRARPHSPIESRGNGTASTLAGDRDPPNHHHDRPPPARLLVGPPARYTLCESGLPPSTRKVDDDLLRTIRETLDSQGNVVEHGAGWEWSSDLDIVRVSLERASSGTTVRIVGDAGWDRIASYGAPVIFLAVLVAGMGFSTVTGVGTALVPPFVVTSYGVGRTAWALVGRRFERKLAKLMRRLVAQLDP